MRLTILAAALLVPGMALAEEPGYLFDALRLPKYRASWTKLIKDVQPTPDWLLHFDKTLDGVSGELKPATVAGKPAKLSFVCKPEDCAGHKFEVLFDGDGARAFGALGGVNDTPAFFGGPDAAQQEALTKAIHPVSAAQSKSE